MFRVCIVTMLVILVAAGADAQRRGGAPPAGGGPGRGGRGGASTVERITVHGTSLEGNRDGDSADRAVTVYLPPSYAADQNRRYPTVYLLHGEGGNESTFLDGAALQQSADRLAAAQGFSEFIVVTPNASVRGSGMYTNSAATGDWERFIADDLVAYVDSHYRTLAHRMSRGIAGHSPGGHAALRLGMKRPEVFANLYAMSPDASALTEMVAQYASNLGLLYAIAIDVGTADTRLDQNRQLHAALTKLRIPHTFEEYDGVHTDRIRERMERNVLVFFARHLAAPANLTSPAPGADRLSKGAP
jgi:S-formylglutathione hydrolase FrmB